jgi:HEPN domain-containing protein/predicted nucleotidyltransferase
MKTQSLVVYIRDQLIKGAEPLPFSLAAALLFGSAAKGVQKDESDIDLLIVAEGINPKLHRRGVEISFLKRILPELSLDVLLLTKEEVLSNFRNHNPLFLDIAQEGIIVFDKVGIFGKIISQTRQYINEKGIRKYGDGWIFPVKRGMAVYLSKISNQDFSLAMLKDSDRDCQIGKRLIQDGYYDKAVYHFQQSVEKAVKSILIAFGVFQKTHLTGAVLRRVLAERDIPPERKESLLELAEISEVIEPEVSLSRYPGIINDSLWLPFEEYEKADAEAAMERAGRALRTANEFITDWFSGS